MRARTPDRLPELTERQLEVARLVARDLSNREIAERLGVSLDTAKAHVSALLSRLNLERREEIAAWYGRRNRRSLLGLFGLLWPLGAPAAATAVVVTAGVIFFASSAPFDAPGAPALTSESPTEIVEEFLDHYIALLRDYRHVDGTFEPNPEAAPALALTSARVRGIVSDAAADASEALFELVLVGAVPIEPPLIEAARVGVLDASVLTTWTWRPGGPDVRETVIEREFHLVLEDGRWTIDFVDLAPVTIDTEPENLVRFLVTLHSATRSGASNSEFAMRLRSPLVDRAIGLFTARTRDEMGPARGLDALDTLFEPVSDYPLSAAPELIEADRDSALVLMRRFGPGLYSSDGGPVQRWTLAFTDEGWRIDGLTTDPAPAWTAEDAALTVARAAGSFGVVVAPDPVRARLASANLPVFSERLAAELLRSGLPLDLSIARLFGLGSGEPAIPTSSWSASTPATGVDRTTVLVSLRLDYARLGVSSVGFADGAGRGTHHIVHLILEQGQWRVDAVEEVEAG